MHLVFKYPKRSKIGSCRQTAATCTWYFNIITTKSNDYCMSLYWRQQAVLSSRSYMKKFRQSIPIFSDRKSYALAGRYLNVWKLKNMINIMKIDYQINSKKGTNAFVLQWFITLQKKCRIKFAYNNKEETN